MIIGPQGDILCSLEKGHGVTCEDLSLCLQRELRTVFPVLKHIQLMDKFNE